MNIVGLLSWYDESPSWLAETVASASKLCTHLIAVDGAYASYPGALRAPVSTPDQAEVIARTAAGVGMSCTVHTPSGPWWGGEVEKRSFMFELARPVARDGWLLVIDADEVLHTVPPDTRDLLRDTDLHVVTVNFWHRTAGGRSPIRRLFRSLPDLTVEQAHYVYVATIDGVRTALWGNEKHHVLAPAVASDVVMEHREHLRPETRKQAKAAYYKQLPDLEYVAPL